MFKKILKGLKPMAIAGGIFAAVMAVLLALFPASVAYGIMLTLFAFFLIMLVLVQRGRGGGLAGALGGPGGSSAFGAKAGDSFTYATIIGASLWIILCVMAAYWGKNLRAQDVLGADDPPAAGADADDFPGDDLFGDDVEDDAGDPTPFTDDTPTDDAPLGDDSSEP